MFGKVLRPNWRENAVEFLNLFREFISPSCNIGLIQFHNITHCIKICEKYNVGVGCLGLDQIIESLHTVINSEIIPNVEKIRSFSVNHTFTEDNPAPKSYIERLRSVHSRQLEMSLQSLQLKPVAIENFDYLKTVTIDKALISKFDKKAHENGLLTKLTSTKMKKISNSVKNLNQ